MFAALMTIASVIGATVGAESMNWKDNGGQRWRETPEGFVEIEDEGVPRTVGEPMTAHTILVDFESDIFDACEEFDVDPALVVALIWKESRKGEGNHRDTVSLRFERTPDSKGRYYISDTKTPDKISAGLMQTLLSTAQRMNKKYELFESVTGKRDTIDRGDLFIPRRSIYLGVAYLATLQDKYGDDPVLLQAAYNAGGVYSSTKNRWNLRTFGTNRTEKFIEYYNDTVEVLRRREAGIV